MDCLIDMGMICLVYLVVYAFLYFISNLLSKSYSSNPLIFKFIISELFYVNCKLSKTIVD